MGKLVTGKVVFFGDSKFGGSSLKLDNTEFLSSRSPVSDSPEAVAKGDTVTVETNTVEKNGKTYHNYEITSIQKGASGASAPASSGGGGGGNAADRVDGAVRGMAFNNAVTIALAAGKSDDDAFLVAQTVRLYKLQASIEAAIKAAPAAEQAASVDSVLDGLDFGNAA